MAQNIQMMTAFFLMILQTFLGWGVEGWILRLNAHLFFKLDGERERRGIGRKPLFGKFDLD